MMPKVLFSSKSHEILKEFYLFGLKFGNFLASKNQDRLGIAVSGCDQSLKFCEAVVKGLTSSGVHVHNYGTITLTDLFHCQNSQTTECIYIRDKCTMSESIICIKKDRSVYSREELEKIYEIIPKKSPDYIGLQVFEGKNKSYLKFLESIFKRDDFKNLKVIWYAEAQVMYQTVISFLNHLDINWIHPPKKNDAKNQIVTQNIIRHILDHSADLGIVFDDLGREVIFIDNLGRIIEPDVVSLILLKDLRNLQNIDSVELFSHSSFAIRQYLQKLETVFVDEIGVCADFSNANNAYYWKNMRYIDGIFTALYFAKIIKKSNKNITNLIQELPTIYKLTYKTVSIGGAIEYFIKQLGFKKSKLTHNTTSYQLNKSRIILTKHLEGYYITFEDESWVKLYKLKNQFINVSRL